LAGRGARGGVVTSRLRIIATGLIAQHAGLGGVVWDYMQYVVGLARLGHDVYYIEDSGEWPYTIEGGLIGMAALTSDCRANASYLADVMTRFGLSDRWAYRCAVDGTWFGLAEARRREAVRSADLVVNVSGSLECPKRYASAARLAYIDTDPVFTQIKLALGPAKFQAQVRAHDAHFTFGETLSAPFNSGPIRWLPTRHPILLDAWRSEAPRGAAFTTVMSWTSYEPLRFEGRSYGQKDVEFRRFLELPAMVGASRLEVAMGPTHHYAWESDASALPSAVRAFLHTEPRRKPAELLAHFGWGVVDSTLRCGDADSYRNYVLSSLGEWSVAKHGYVAARSGWFSGRSGCYLAAGRPVVLQDTGFSDVLPTGLGLLAFTTPDEAAAAIAEIARAPGRHGKAAREVAEAHFDSAEVLSAIVEVAMRAEPQPASTS
jgi:hypothetical protein